MKRNIAIHWFRQDLRLSDNSALHEAAKQYRILPIYILDDKNAGKHCMGGASRWWLHHSLAALHESLGSNLYVFSGDPEPILLNLVKQYDVKAIYWNRCYEPWRTKRDKRIRENLKAQTIDTKSFNGALLWEPWEILKADGSPYKVFTRFYRSACANIRSPWEPLAKPENLDTVGDTSNTVPIEDLNLLPGIRWDKKCSPIGRLAKKVPVHDWKCFLKMA